MVQSITMKQQLLLSLAILAIYLPISFGACPSGFSQSGSNCIKWFHKSGSNGRNWIKSQCNQVGGTTSSLFCEYIGGGSGGGMEPRIDTNDTGIVCQLIFVMIKQNFKPIFTSVDITNSKITPFK